MNANNSVRLSNFELLRIVAMFGIVLHHLVIKGASTCGYVTPYNYEKDGFIGLILNSLVVGGGELFCFNNRMVWCIKTI